MRSVVRCLVAVAFCIFVHGCTMPTGKPGKGDRLLDVSLYTLDGQRTSLLAAARGKVAVFKFGASWCKWCTTEIPHLNEIARRYAKDPVVVFEIDLQEPAKVAKAYAEKNGVEYLMLLDPRATASALYSISAIPVTIIAEPDGTIAHRGGYMTLKELDRVVAPLVAKARASQAK